MVAPTSVGRRQPYTWDDTTNKSCTTPTYRQPLQDPLASGVGGGVYD